MENLSVLMIFPISDTLYMLSWESREVYIKWQNDTVLWKIKMLLRSFISSTNSSVTLRHPRISKEGVYVLNRGGKKSKTC